MSLKIQESAKAGLTYREESVGIPVLSTVLVLVLVAAPLFWTLVRINRDGVKSTDISRYEGLAQAATLTVQTVDAMLRNDEAELAAIRAGQSPDKVTLIIPEIEIKEIAPHNKTKLDVGLINIYWDVANPLVGIEGDTYGVGDKVQGYEIINILKTKVYFRGPDGKTVIKDINEDLLDIVD